MNARPFACTLVAVSVALAASSLADTHEGRNGRRGAATATATAKTARDAAAIRRLRAHALRSSERKRAVIGDDDRTLVASPQDTPRHRATGKVFATFPDGEVSEATAVLVHKKLALTAGHVVYDARHGGFATDVLFIPSFDAGAAPFGEHLADRVFTLSRFVEDADAAAPAAAPFEHDIGALWLRSKPGAQAGFVPSRALARDTQFQTLDTAGYPADLDDAQRLYAATGAVLPVTDGRRLALDEALDNFGGQSGGGAFVHLDGTARVAGVITGAIQIPGDEGPVLLNIARRLTPDVGKLLRRWRKGRGEKRVRTKQGGRVRIVNRTDDVIDVVRTEIDGDRTQRSIGRLVPGDRLSSVGLTWPRLYRFAFDEGGDGTLDDAVLVYLDRKRRTIRYESVR